MGILLAVVSVGRRNNQQCPQPYANSLLLYDLLSLHPVVVLPYYCRLLARLVRNFQRGLQPIVVPANL